MSFISVTPVPNILIKRIFYRASIGAGRASIEAGAMPLFPRCRAWTACVNGKFTRAAVRLLPLADNPLRGLRGHALSRRCPLVPRSTRDGLDGHRPMRVVRQRFTHVGRRRDERCSGERWDARRRLQNAWAFRLSSVALGSATPSERFGWSPNRHLLTKSDC